MIHMIRRIITGFLTAVLVFGFARAPLCAGTSANDVARLLAGKPVGEASALKDVMESPVWKAHAAEFDRVWKLIETDRLPAMRRFQASQLDDARIRQRVLLYPFGGPDVFNAVALFPHNPAYILIGLEPIGDLPDENALRSDLDRLLDSVRESLGSLFQRSFFITREMDRSLRGQMFSGVLPDLLVQLARLDGEILSVSTVHVAEGGVIAPWDRTKVRARAVSNRGVEILFRSKGAPAAQRLYYFSVNLGPKLASNRAFLTYLDRTAPFVTFLKSTSYMPHQKEFRAIREEVLATSDVVLQDDSGLPYSCYQSPEWELQLYGEYEKPYGSFHYLEQPDLHRAYETPGAAKPLEFRIGYGFGKVPSNLLLARRKAAPTPAPRAFAGQPHSSTSTAPSP
jgi:hypothetical protein